MAGTVCTARVGSIATPHASAQTSRLNVQKSHAAVRPSLVSSTTLRSAGFAAQSHRKPLTVTCGLGDFVGGDLIGLDIGQWLNDVETHGSVGFYAPPEGGAELRYGSSLKYAGYHVMQVSARGLGDPEAYLLKTHGVRPVGVIVQSRSTDCVTARFSPRHCCDRRVVAGILVFS